MSEVVTLEQLVALEGLSSIDAHFARLCVSAEHRGAEEDAEAASERQIIALLAASVSRALREGHPCVPLSALDGLAVCDADGHVVGSFPPLERLRWAARRSVAIETGEALGEVRDCPLVLDGQDRLYAARYFEHERILADRLAILLSRADDQLDQAWLEARLAHYFPPSGSEPDLQREAAERAIERRFTVISGGPGTGKTSTVVKILALLLEKARQGETDYPVIRLMAPTGKAAARMSEAVESAMGRLELDEEIRAHMVSSATTIHRALGVLPYNATRFARGRERRLQADVVLVDEASMVDLGLMRHLVDALRPGARLILLGDRNQLSSVEAGSVLAELCTSFGGEGEKQTEAVVELKRSYRFQEGSGIFALAQAIRDGEGEAAERVFVQGYSDLNHGGELDWEASQLRAVALEFYGAALRETEPEAVLDAMNRFRVLCAHRKGHHGVEGVNEAVRRWLSGAGLVPREGEFYRGRLLLVTQNDYGVNLQNGDVGLVWPDAEGKLVAYFPCLNEEGEAQLRALSLAQLPSHESAFAMTIHKSQGSEHDEIAVLLPEESSPLLTRELVYTGITRAKQRAHLYGPLSSLRVAASRSVTRYSGLGAALRERANRA